MLYVAKLGAFDYSDFKESVEKFKRLYPKYNPKQNIYKIVCLLWRYCVKENEAK